ncbi:30S ribosomal protein S17 [Mycoplasmoides pirum]|uniref:30S ribosomal protein S17 n=1 Tax=Mycoplasmoides pirum TaxID=2122 RepID=UPI0004848DBA|nr:30S ribosomal protein S17 [Mycoplasmoides pirum]
MERNRRKTLIGKVVSDKMKLTATVEVELKTKHPLYHKLVIKHKRYHAHNDLAEPAKVGDRVEIMETRPLSATKRWRISNIVERAK